MKTLRVAVLLGCFFAVAGCGDGPKLAAVSGRITVDGRAYPNAYVVFQPVGSKSNPNPGRGSMSVTDGDGRFTLSYDGGDPGAVIGKHIVRITTRQEADDPDAFQKYSKTGTPDGEPIPGQKGLRAEIIPPEWNSESTKEFDVPAGGTDQANFDIVTKKGKGR